MTRRIAPDLLAKLVAALLASALVALWLQRPGTPQLQLTADFNRAGLNIRAGDEVRVRGFPVGTVEKISVDRKDFSARYTIAVKKGTPIAADSGAKVVPKTLFGDKYLELDAAGPGQPRMRDGAAIPRSRTKTVTEFQQVLDRFTPALQAIDPGELGATIQALAAGIGDGGQLGRTISGFGTGVQTFGDRQADIALLLRHTPGVAQTFGEQSDNLTAVATNLGKLSEDMARHEPTLARFLASNADLLSRAGELLTTEEARIQRITQNGFTVLDHVAAHPGAIAGFMRGQADDTVGIISVTHRGVMWAAIPHLIVNFPTPLPKGGITDDRQSIGPDMEFDYPPPPGGPIDLGPLTQLLPGLAVPGILTPTASPSTGTASANPLAPILQGLTGSGR